MLWKYYLVALATISFLTFLLYALDKEKAKRSAWRISEKTLLLLSFFGGAAGGYLAMNLVRHKTKKWHFHFVNIVGLIWQIALLAYLLAHPNIL
jgi:uncharacterized membrane protein YsdA (DUF1294 family)